MLRLIATRFALGIITLLAVSVLIFICTQILPGDVASAVLGQQATPEALKVFRQELGLDQPAYLRYLNWLIGVLHGDFGKALTNQRVIIDELGPRFLNTLFLAAYAAIIAVPLAVGLGIISAIREGRLADRLANILTLIAISVPEFFVAYILIIIFADQSGLVPLARHRRFRTWGSGQRIYVAFLPALTLTMVVMRAHDAHDAQLRAVDHVDALYRDGVPQGPHAHARRRPSTRCPMRWGRSSRSSRSTSPISSSASSWSRTCSSIPASANRWSTRVAKRDVPVMQACGLIFAAVFVILNTLADILAILANPRLRRRRMRAAMTIYGHRPPLTARNRALHRRRLSADGDVRAVVRALRTSRNRSATPGRRPPRICGSAPTRSAATC